MKSLTDHYVLRNGVKIPCVGFGTWQTPGGDVAEHIVEAAIRAGYRHIDTATAYENEDSVGRGIKNSGIPREELFITTKLWNVVKGYQETIDAFNQSMEWLGTDYCDLYLIHWPDPVHYRDCWQERNEQCWKAMEDLYLQGKIRAIGISNFYPHHIEALLKTAVIMPMVNQIRLHPGCQQRYLVEYTRKLGMLPEAYSPLGTGALLGNETVAEIAAQYKKSPAQVLIRWNLQKGFLPLPKSVTDERVIQNTDVFDFTLSPEAMEKLDSLDGVITYSDHPDMVEW